MNRQIIRSRVVIDTGQPDVTLGKEQHVRCSAGDEEVRADIELLPFQEQRLVNIPVREVFQHASLTSSHSTRRFKAHAKPHSQFVAHNRTGLFVPFSSTGFKVDGSRGRLQERLEMPRTAPFERARSCSSLRAGGN